MIYLAGILMVLVSFLAGKGALSIFYGKTKRGDLTGADALAAGCMVCVGLGEAAHLAGLLLHWSFADCAKLWRFAVVAAAALGGMLLLWEAVKKNDKNVRSTANIRNIGVSFRGAGGGGTYLLYQALLVPAAILVLLQMIVILTETPVYLQGDMTLESANSFLASNAIYRVNPLTGTEIAAGMPIRFQILCLPTVYGSISYLFGIRTQQTVWQLVPVFVLCCFYVTAWQIGGILFPQSKVRQAGFLLFTAALLQAGDYLYGMDGFNFLHSGFRGVSFRGAVLLPYTISAALRRRWKLAALCALTEMCVVWTLYGMGACLPVAAGMWIADAEWRRKGVCQ